MSFPGSAPDPRRASVDNVLRIGHEVDCTVRHCTPGTCVTSADHAASHEIHQIEHGFFSRFDRGHSGEQLDAAHTNCCLLPVCIRASPFTTHAALQISRQQPPQHHHRHSSLCWTFHDQQISPAHVAVACVQSLPCDHDHSPPAGSTIQIDPLRHETPTQAFAPFHTMLPQAFDARAAVALSSQLHLLTGWSRHASLCAKCR